jgi:hypothetical protein
MKSYYIPSYPDLFTLDLNKLAEVESNCRKAGHLDPNECLLDRISKDLLILEKYGLKKEDIYTNH